MNAVLETQALGKSYGRRQALADCTLQIPPGHVVGLVGPNGAGKSTILKIMAGLDQPSNGEARLSPGYSVGILLPPGMPWSTIEATLLAAAPGQ